MDLEEIAQEIRTQDNLATADPIFILFDRIKIPTDSHYSDDYIYLDVDNDNSEVDGNREALLQYVKDEFDQITYSPLNVNKVEDLDKLSEEELLDLMEKDRNHFDKVYVKKIDVFKQAFFTNKSAEQYMNSNKHHFNDPYIYCESLWRNHEMKVIREALIKGAFAKESETNE